jgi:hypothetical protein
MNTSEIETLLDKFYEGNSSLSEEKILREFFQGPDVPAHLEPHQPLFVHYATEMKQGIGNEDFERELTAKLTEKPGERPAIRLQPNRNRFLFISGIAAGILLLIGLFFTFQQDVFKNRLGQAGTTDPAIAYADASEALMLVSGNLNNGLRQVERLQMVDKAMKNVQLFNKFYQYQTIIINPDEISNRSIKSK